MKKLMTAVMMMSAVAFAAPPAAAPAKTPAPKTDDRFGDRGARFAERAAERQHRMHMMAVVMIADALELNEVDAVKLSDKLKGFEERKRPIREQMFESMKTLRAAADGEAGALTQVDAALQRVLDGRSQMAAIDKEMFNSLATGQTPQKKARLALVMARFGQQARMQAGGGMEHEGRRGTWR